MTSTAAPLVRVGQDESLDKWMKFLGALDCLCDFSWIGMGRLHGIDMGKGWVRITTHPKCPQHALCRGYTAGVRAKRDNGRYLNCPVHRTKNCNA